MTSSRTSWKVLIGLIIITAIFVGVTYGSNKGIDNVLSTTYVKNPSDLGVATSTVKATSTLGASTTAPVFKLIATCAAPGKNQIMATGSTTKKLMWAVTPSVEGVVVKDVTIEWNQIQPTKKVISSGKDIFATLFVNRSDFKPGVTKMTFVLQPTITTPSGQKIVAKCASVDVTLK